MLTQIDIEDYKEVSEQPVDSIESGKNQCSNPFAYFKNILESWFPYEQKSRENQATSRE